MQPHSTADARALELAIELGWLRRERMIALAAIALLALGAIAYYVLIAAPIVHADDAGGTTVAELTLSGLFQVTWVAVAIAAAAVVQVARIVRLSSQIQTLRGRRAIERAETLLRV